MKFLAPIIFLNTLCFGMVNANEEQKLQLRGAVVDVAEASPLSHEKKEDSASNVHPFDPSYENEEYLSGPLVHDSRQLQLNELIALLFNGVISIFLPLINDVLQDKLQDFDPLLVDVGDIIELSPDIPVLNDMCEVELDLSWIVNELTGLADIQIESLEMKSSNNIIQGGPFENKRFSADFQLTTKMPKNKILKADVGAAVEALVCGFYMGQNIAGEAGVSDAYFDMDIRLEGTMGVLGLKPKLKNVKIQSIDMLYTAIDVDMDEPDLDRAARKKGDAKQQRKLQKAMNKEIAVGIDGFIAESVKPAVATAFEEAVDQVLPLKLF